MLTVQEILHPQVLTKSYSQRRAKAPTPLTDAFFVNPEQCDTDTYTQVFDPAENQIAPLNQSGASARTMDQKGLKERKGTIFSAFNKIPFYGDLLLSLREPDSPAMQKRGTSEVIRQQTTFVERHRRLKEVVLGKTLCDGVVYVAPNGMILESATGAESAATFEIDASHQGNLGGVIDKYISDSSADLQAWIVQVCDLADQANVPMPTEVWCHTSLKSILRENLQFMAWAAPSGMAVDTILKGQMIQGLWGMNWHFVVGYYQGSDGQNHPVFNKKKMVFTPAPTDPCFKPVEGRSLIPSKLASNYAGDAIEALSQFDEVYGPYSYATLGHNPPTVEMYMGDKFALHFNDPNCIWQATVLA